MSNHRYTKEFKLEVLEMAAQGEKNIPELERDLGITPGLLYKWRQRYQVDEVRGKLAPSEDCETAAEIRRLKRELEVMRQERDILKKRSRSSRRAGTHEVCLHCGSSRRLSHHDHVSGVRSINQWVLRLVGPSSV